MRATLQPASLGIRPSAYFLRSTRPAPSGRPTRALLPKLDAAARAGLGGRCVEVHVIEFGVRFRLALGPGGFAPAPAAAPVSLRIAAPAEVYWRMAEGTEDADTLFFERRLVMEGDTELGLLLKNTLDAVGPLVPQVLARRA